MRNVAAAVLAAPVLLALYFPVLARRSVAVRVGLFVAIGLLVGVGLLGLSRPAAITATGPSAPITAVADDAFRSIAVATDLRAPVRITFSEAMDPASVASALTVSPATDVSFRWNGAATVVTITPKSHWAAATYHTISVAPGALAASGRPMSSSVQAAFVTRSATSGTITATRLVGRAAMPGTGFRIAFDRAVNASDLSKTLRLTPPVAGSLEAVGGRPDTSLSTASSFVFQPTTALKPGTTYRVTVDGLVDVDGAAIAASPKLAITTTKAPHVVRFRPLNGTQKVDRGATLSVRFSEGMTHATTRAALVVTADGKPVAGSVMFAEGSSVLVFTPKAALPYGAFVLLKVGSSATALTGIPMTGSSQFAVRVVAKPAAKKIPTPLPPRSGGGGGGGGSVGGGSWGAVEVYYLKLMNCTRTGGWVTSSGACSSPGGRSVKALWIDAGISTKVSRPYAKKIAISGVCTHFSGGTPGDRLRAAGYTSWTWAENLGCQGGNPYRSALNTHIYFQSEKSYGGGHYVNMMNAAYDRVGIGVWVASGRLRLVIDFYHPR